MDLIDIFEHVLQNARSIDIAESEFKRLLLDDPELKTVYKAWCKEQDTTEKNGFVDYCSQRFDEEETCWEALEDEYEY
ncbi:MAG: hypothetical protein NC217_03485 [Muribaculaceae bacterium]|nr:hypothetical protein [Muribaculaceae bacterium]